MDAETLQGLSQLMRAQRVAALGTLLDGAPLVTMVPFAAACDFGAFHIHVSALAQHTRALKSDARVSLMIAEPDAPGASPQTLARLSIRGEASELAPPEIDAAKALYLAKFPDAAFNFTLADFSLWRIAPREARFVADFGRIFDLGPDDLRRAAAS